MTETSDPYFEWLLSSFFSFLSSSSQEEILLNDTSGKFDSVTMFHLSPSLGILSIFNRIIIITRSEQSFLLKIIYRDKHRQINTAAAALVVEIITKI